MNQAKIAKKFQKYFRLHFEWIAFSVGILAMALMNPYTDSGATWCLFERMGVPFCPGHGLGHSIAFIFRGDFANALNANILGPFALVVLLGRITYLLKQRFLFTNDNLPLLNKKSKNKKLWQN
ncbi:MAG TPA: DUF2752 domain-containing protein [Balneolaceae bacterium]|nr:DUF2752 domain-containing protein [Balneolaceae bacterium]